MQSKPFAAGRGQLSYTNSSGQLVALTEWGVVSVWTVMALPPAAQGADADVGLRVGSQMCLHLTATLLAGNALQPCKNMLALDNASQLCMEVGRHAAALAIPANTSNQFLVGMDSTQILRGSFYGNLHLPKVISRSQFWTWLPACHCSHLITKVSMIHDMSNLCQLMCAQRKVWWCKRRDVDHIR